MTPEPTLAPQDALKRVMRGDRLTREESRAVFTTILDEREHGPATPGLLCALAARGEAAEELAGLVDLLVSRATAFPVSEAVRSRALDVCGTGGDGAGTFNISTATAFVVAAAGVGVAKHGGRSVSSRCGSADVLAALGAVIDPPADVAARLLEESNFTFLFAPHYHPGMKSVAILRRALGVRTIFNLAGPLSNPACVKRQIVGVDHPSRVPAVAGALSLRGMEHVLVFSHESGADELLPHGGNVVAEVKGCDVREFTLTAGDFGLAEQPEVDLCGGDALENAAILRSLLGGKEKGKAETVIMNAAAALVVAEKATGWKAAASMARHVIETQEGLHLLSRYVERSQRAEEAP